MSVNLGDKVKDSITNLTGIAVGKIEYLWGCKRVLVAPPEIKDGKPVEETWFDESRVLIVERAVQQQPANAVERRGGIEGDAPSSATQKI